jgi:long-chain acyl-CoA synthetase
MVSDLLSFIEDNLNTGKRFYYHKYKYRVWIWSFKEIYRQATKFASLLSKSGIGKNDKVLLKGTNRPEWVIAFIGCLIRGVVVVPLDSKSGFDFDLKVQAKVNARALITDNSASILRSNFSIRTIYFDDFGDILSNLPSYDYHEDVNNFDDLAEIVFTSGTTSDPKGVMITYGNIVSNLNAVIPVMNKYIKIFNLMVNPKILSLVPLSHMYGQLIGVFTPLMIGSSIMFSDNLSPQNILKVIKEEKIWVLGLLPKLMEILKDYITIKFNLSSNKFKSIYQKTKPRRWQVRLWTFRKIHFNIGWRLVTLMVGGAALDSSVEEFWRCLAYSMFQGYGLTETSPLITLADPTNSIAGSIGKALSGQEIRLVENEIYVRGPNVSEGYFGDESKTNQVFSKGWFKTGDLAEIDKNGNIFFKGRKDDVIVRPDGINVYPDDIETVLKSIESVKDCTVIGVKYERYDEIYAILILKDSAKHSAEEVVRIANSRLNIYQKIDNYFVWEKEDFSRTPTMKVKKSEIIQFINENQKKIKKDKFKAAPKIYELINSFHKLRKGLKPQDRLESDLGLDSLDLIQVAASIEEKYNIEIDDSLITRDTTVKDLENLINLPPKKTKKIPFYSFPYWTIVRVIRTAFQYFLYPFISVLYRLKVYGRENLKNLHGPAVFAANHSSNLDTFVLLYSMPLLVRVKVTALMSIEYHFRNFFYGKGSWLRRIIEAIGFYMLVNLAINACPLSRTHGFKQVLENVGKLIDKGWSILIFPEGEVTTDGKIKKFESGIGIIAADMKVPVIPVKIEGLYNILHNGILPLGHKPRWPKITVTFGKPVLFRNKSYNEVANELEDIIKKM